MIRALLVSVLFILGLGAAAVGFGQMHHLRLVASDALPEWSATVAADATLRQGSMIVPMDTPLPDLTVAWQAKAPTGSGWPWDVTVTGDGVDISAELVVSLGLSEAVITLVDGTITIAEIAPFGTARGFVEAMAGTATVTDLRGARVPQATLSASVRGLTVLGTALGDGPTTADLAETGAWAWALVLSGGVSGASAEATGVRGQDELAYTVHVDDVEAIPTALRRLLTQRGEADGAGWTISGVANRGF